jgi:glutaredoxin
MKQQCYIFFIYVSWLILLGGFIFLLIQGQLLQSIFWIIFVGLFLWLYVRYFPSISRYLGYGSVVDQPAKEIHISSIKVMLYTGVGCPFCPIVKRRLIDLQSKLGYELSEMDVTLRPSLLIAKGIYALPVIEIGEAHWIGNATSEQLASFIAVNAGALTNLSMNCNTNF